MKPLLSIVTVVKNDAEGLEKTIKSVLKQSFKNLEYIIIGGKSTDNTDSVIGKYANFLKNFIIEEDEGLYHAMNKAIQFCDGQYYQFLNAGDTLTTNSTLQKVNTIIEQDTDIFCGSIHKVEQNKKRYYKNVKFSVQPLDDMFCCHQAIIARKHIFEEFQFDTQYKVSADYHWLLKCLYHGFKFQFSELPVVDFKGGGFSCKNNILRTVENMYIQSKYIDNMSKIFSTHTFSSFISCNNSNNVFFNKLFNNLLKEFENLIPKYNNFILYGFGNIGKTLFYLYPNYFEKIYDQNYVDLSKEHSIEINSPDGIQIEKENLIIVSCLGHEPEVTSFLKAKGLSKIFNFDI